MAAKILVVEDDRLVLATLTSGLKAHGFEVAQASSGQKALVLAPSFAPHLALVDVRLPDLSGPEVAKTLDSQYGIPVLFLSAYDDQDTVDQALRAGGLGYLVKPLAVTHLVPALQAALALGQRMKKMKGALASNQVINLAVGVLMERNRLLRQEAFELLRRRARSERCKVQELASKVVEMAEGLNCLGNPVKPTEAG